MTYATFIELHPEFSAIAEAVVQNALDEAAADTDSTVCGSLTSKVVRLKAADELARSPFAQQAGLVDDEGKTPYQKSLDPLVEKLGLSYRTVLE